MAVLTNSASLMRSHIKEDSVSLAETSEIDRRCWRHREDLAKDGEVESVIFASPEAVPTGEGWVWHPSEIEFRPKKPEPAPETCAHCGQTITRNENGKEAGEERQIRRPEIRGRQDGQEDGQKRSGGSQKEEALDLDSLDKKDLLEIARAADVQVEDRWSVKKIKQALREA